MINRRMFLLAGAALAACGPKPEGAHEPKKLMAVTMDDFNLGFDVKLAPDARNDAILAAFAAHNHKAAGFISGEYVDNALGRDVVKSKRFSFTGNLWRQTTWLMLPLQYLRWIGLQLTVWRNG